MSITGELRSARDALIPQMESLGPQLAYSDTIVSDALASRLNTQGVDPAQILEADMNKAERHVLIGFFIRQLRHLLVEGGPEGDVSKAHFRPSPEAVVTHFTRRGIALLEPDLRATFGNGAAAIENMYTHGTRGKWFPIARKRVVELGLRAYDLAEPFKKDGPNAKVPIALEGIDIREGLRNKALPEALLRFLGYIQMKVPDPAERLKAAHDLHYLLALLAGRHLEEFKIAPHLDALARVPLRQDDDGTYRLDGSMAKGALRQAYPRISAAKLPNATLKCAAHANTLGDHTDLEYFGHGAINAAFGGYQLFEETLGSAHAGPPPGTEQGLRRQRDILPSSSGRATSLRGWLRSLLGGMAG